MPDDAQDTDAQDTDVGDFLSIVSRLRDDLNDVRGLFDRYRRIREHRGEVERLVASARRADGDLALIAERLNSSATIPSPMNQPTQAEEAQVTKARTLRDAMINTLERYQRIQDAVPVYH